MDVIEKTRRSRIDPSVDAIALELSRRAADVGPWSLDELRGLPFDVLRACAELLEHRRVLQMDAAGRAEAVRAARADLEELLRGTWLACVQGEVVDPALRRRCETAHELVERLERELVFVRGALHGTGEDLLALLRRPRPVARASA